MLDNQEVVIQAKGIHSQQPRMVRGTSARSRQAARDMASRPPLQAAANLLAENVVGDVPPLQTIKSARRNWLSQNQDPANQGSDEGLLAWRQWLQQASSRQANGVTDVLELQVHHLSGDICALVALAFVEAAKMAIQNDTYGESYAVADCSFKLNKSRWTLFLLGLSAKHKDDSGRWRSELLPLTFGWAPKEDAESLNYLLSFSVQWYEERGLSLRALKEAGVRTLPHSIAPMNPSTHAGFGIPAQVHWDNTAAGRSAHAVVLSGVLFRRCLRHQLAAVRRYAGAQKKFVVATIHFTAACMNPFLFHLIWSSVLERIDEPEWREYVEEHVLQRSGGLWTAEWYKPPRLADWDLCGDDSVRPGFTSASLGQSIESWWSAAKRCMPGNVGHMTLQNATLELQKYLRASWQVQKGYVKDNRVQEPGEDRSRPWPTSFNPKLLSEGLVERNKAEDGYVHRWPPVTSLVQHAPANYCFQNFEVLEFHNVRRIYMVPGTDADLRVEQD